METIAIIDDDIYIGDMLEKVLKKKGMRRCALTPGQKR